MIIHVVKPGETIFSISQIYGVTPEQIINANELSSPDKLAVGQTLVILFYETVYTVEKGDTLEAIATRYGTTVIQLMRNNPSLNGIPLIYPGQTIVISYTGEKVSSLEVNGYAYTFIDRAVLRKTLPYLTYLTVFTYGFTDAGDLITPDPDDTDIVNIVNEYSARPVMLISTLTEDGVFNNQLSSRLFKNPQAQDNLISNILENMRQKGYYALDIDFEFVLAEDADDYVDFVSKVSSALNNEGFKVFVSLAPKYYTEQPGLLYQGHDFPGLGAASDRSLLMTYEWGYTYGPPMAIAPLNKVKEVVDYAISQIPQEKILLGIPNYAYDWKLPYVKGESKAEALSNVNAVDLAINTNSVIQFDQLASSPFFYYMENGTDHEVWFEDARSIFSKLELASSELRGVSFWNIMKYFPQSWLVLNSIYNIETIE